ncbi:MAG: hypothetical protein ABJB69_02345 [Spartobacteria bacterium]
MIDSWSTSLATALKAKIPPERMINFMSILQLKQWVKSVRR